MKSYKDLEVYQTSFNLYIETHKFSFSLPNHEKFELGSQLRRSSDSIVSKIVEGYGRRIYKSDFLKFLIYAHASSLETMNHLEKINVLYPDLVGKAQYLIKKYDILGAQIYRFIEYVRRNWRT